MLERLNYLAEKYVCCTLIKNLYHPYHVVEYISMLL